MREIKFRGKRLDNGEWVYGYIQFSKDKSSAWICESKEDDWTVKNQFPVDPKTVGQYTGLKYKDGKAVWEDDITEHDGKRYRIGWDNKGFQLFNIFAENSSGGTGNKSYPWLKDKEKNCINLLVIGNIHDNPELLEVEHG